MDIQMLKTIDASSKASELISNTEKLNNRERVRYLLLASTSMALRGAEFSQVHELLRSASEINLKGLNEEFKESLLVEAALLFLIRAYTDEQSLDYLSVLSEQLQLNTIQAEKLIAFLQVKPFSNTENFSQIFSALFSTADDSLRDEFFEQPEWIEALVALSDGDEDILLRFADMLCKEGVEPPAVRRFIEASLAAANMPLSAGRRLKERVASMKYGEEHDEQAALLVKAMIASGHQEECRQWTVSTDRELAFESIIELLRDGSLKVDELEPFEIRSDRFKAPDFEARLRYWTDLLRKNNTRLSDNMLRQIAYRIVEDVKNGATSEGLPLNFHEALGQLIHCRIFDRGVWEDLYRVLPKAGYAALFLSEHGDLVRADVDEMGSKWSSNKEEFEEPHPAIEILEMMTHIENGPVLFKGFEEVLPFIPEEEYPSVEPWIWLQGAVGATVSGENGRARWYLQKMCDLCEYSARGESGVEPPLLPLLDTILATDDTTLRSEIADIITKYISTESVGRRAQELSVEKLRLTELTKIGFENLVVWILKSISDKENKRYRRVIELLQRLEGLNFDGRTINVFAYLTHIKYFHGPTHAIRAAARHGDWELVEELLALSVEDLLLKNESEAYDNIRVRLQEGKDIDGLDNARKNWAHWRLSVILQDILFYDPPPELLQRVFPDVTIDWRPVAEQLLDAGGYSKAIELILQEDLADLAPRALRAVPDALRYRYEMQLLSLIEADEEKLAHAGDRKTLTELTEKLSKAPGQIKKDGELLEDIVLNLIGRGMAQEAIELVTAKMVEE